ncbi:Predicted Kef-type K+ transport protein, K+/H+ antiporter domain [Microbulbifer donghaiensis]|uniref:Predicted Kef-type K+ transport protein, K+/H+ antiporter domain n=1 Tax=Microbulbifer donghaiensis TaxID=494016 RepID=A0A1M4VJC5_9GAMM|nr:cation:proton antiporter [Microbulbifer donghaiensis]SHE68975.1 Predicted Kef-type K+ transport protein, K+/H+ antiporter domain [Microbulbifer donghaiensis]
MAETSLFQSFFLIFSGAAIVASLALFGRQPLLVAYIALGLLLGPSGLAVIDNVQLLAEMSNIGIIFLLFLLGLDMQPQALLSVLRKATFVGLVSCAIFLGLGFAIGQLFGFTNTESWVIGMAMMFSSTIIGIKLLPTTVLHHKHLGEMMVGLLLFQDFVAITCLMILLSGSTGEVDVAQLGLSIAALPLLVFFAWVVVKYLLLPLFTRFDRFHEYVFLLALGWCMGLAELAEILGLSREIGAFIAGITLATSPISQYIALSLKPLRDFFLILFFFSLGAQFKLSMVPEIALPALITAAAVLLVKPVVFRYLLGNQSEHKVLAWDIGFRLGQISEFSLLIAFLAFNQQLIGSGASHLIQATAILTFLVSSYIVVMNFPNPIAIKDELRRD